MKLRVTDSHEAMSQHAAGLIVDEIRRRPDLLMCAATGSTPTRTYELLVEDGHDPGLFDRLRVLKLDEWCGLESEHAATSETYLQKNLIGPLAVASRRYIGFDSNSPHPQAECERVRGELLKNAPIDLCILGLGANGHLGLNEPGELIQPFAHVATLTETTLSHPMLKTVVGGRVSYGLTLGMAEILQSRKVLLLISGAHKRQQVKRLLSPGISCEFPASFLWLHSEVTVLCDRDAAADAT
jgi:galactosamine-6-phosphate isomerase